MSFPLEFISEVKVLLPPPLPRPYDPTPTNRFCLNDNCGYLDFKALKYPPRRQGNNAMGAFGEY